MMNRSTLGGAAIAVLLSQTAAHADLTAEQVWEDWQAQAASYGQPFTAANVGREGDTLVVSGLRISMDADGDGADDVSGTLAEARFQERGDGTVEITMSPDFDMIFAQDLPDGPDVSYTISMDMGGLTMIASGDPDLRRYDYLAPSVKMSLTSLSVDGDQIDGTFQATATGVNGNYVMGSGDPRQVASESNFDAVAFDVDFTDPDGNDGRIVVTGSIADIASTSKTTLLKTADLADMAAMLAAGFAVDGSLTSGAASYVMQAQGIDGSTFNADVSATGGSLDFVMGADGLTYGGSNTGVEVLVSGSEIPFPQVRLTAAEMGGSLTMPIAASQVPQDAGFGLILRDLQVSEMIWSMIDPAGVLPHDPATLIIDAMGTANWNIDIMSPEVQQGNFGDGAPGQIHSMDLRNLQLAIAGAVLTGTGAFTFDSSDMQTYPGAPKPVGKINLSLDGANALLDKLITMGLIPAEQALGFRGMMGMFARPGTGPDTLVSEIELTPDGGIAANGLRLR
jgi:hypothetical protein